MQFDLISSSLMYAVSPDTNSFQCHFFTLLQACSSSNTSGTFLARAYVLAVPSVRIFLPPHVSHLLQFFLDVPSQWGLSQQSYIKFQPPTSSGFPTMPFIALLNFSPCHLIPSAVVCISFVCLFICLFREIQTSWRQGFFPAPGTVPGTE